MKRLWLILLPLLLTCTATACTQDDIVPLPASAKQGEANQLLIPFPYNEKFDGNWQRWVLEKDASGKDILSVHWSNNLLASFPVGHDGVNPMTGEIALGGRYYTVTEIYLHNDMASGWVTLQPR